jgi:hypothetical protein
VLWPHLVRELGFPFNMVELILVSTSSYLMLIAIDAS